MGENLKVVWAEFSNLSQVILLSCTISAWHDMQPLLELKTRPKVRLVSLSLSMAKSNGALVIVHPRRSNN